jgi:ParB family chromosome partitioning protein
MSDIYRDSIFWVEVERIKPNPYQPRREFDQEKLTGLAESIRMYGLLQPLTVTRNEIQKDDGGIAVEYELIAGERRLRASKIAGLLQVPVIIRSGQDTDQMKLELAIIENLQREDLNPVDRAKAFLRLHKEFSFTHVDIGKKVGKSREYVSNTLRLLLLPEAILSYLAEGRMSEGHTRPLLMLNDRPEEQAVLAKEILLKKLTVRESETLARRSAQDKVTARHKINPEILALERKLTEKLGTRVQIEQREVGGKLVISFFSAEDLSTLLNAMQLEKEHHAITPIFDGNPKAPTANLAQKVEKEVQAEIKESEKEIQNVVDSILGNNTLSGDESTEEVSETVSMSDVGETFDSEFKVEDDFAVEHSTEMFVRPESTRPMPEIRVNDVFEPKPFLREEPQILEEDSDLYSIRNFSI